MYFRDQENQSLCRGAIAGSRDGRLGSMEVRLARNRRLLKTVFWYILVRRANNSLEAYIKKPHISCILYCQYFYVVIYDLEKSLDFYLSGPMWPNSDTPDRQHDTSKKLFEFKFFFFYNSPVINWWSRKTINTHRSTKF